jgi:hypothetical protein
MNNLNRQITVDELDFDAIKLSLKEFLRGQSNFTDFDFEGSALSILLDVLAYNTHYNAIYTNFAVNEMFLESASKLSSVTSLAKTIGYTPRSKLASTARINVTVSNVPNNPSSVTMPKNTAFRSEIDKVEYVFLTTSDVTVSNTANQFIFNNLEVIQGESLSQNYITSDSSNYVIPEKDVDMTRINVKVYDQPNSNIFSVFNAADDVLRIKSTDSVFFVKQREDLYYELFFGDGAIGKRPANGSRVVITYYKTAGIVANGCRDFYYAGGWAGDYYYSVTSTGASTNGADEETRDSIKFNAPRYYKTQHRAVTASDYEVILKQHNPLIESIKAWGGEDNNPPIYGKVFISSKPVGRAKFTTEEKDSMVAWLRENRSVLTVVPQFIDASILNIELTSSVYYDPARSDISPDSIRSIVMSTLSEISNNLNQFNMNFLYSQLTGSIDNSYRAITNNITKLRVRNSITPNTGVTYTHRLKYGNAILNNGNGGNIWSTRFFSNDYDNRVYLKDESDGSIWIFSEDQFGSATKKKRVGDVDYNTGEISFTINFRDYYDSDFEIVFEPKSYDILGINNYIISMPIDLVELTVMSNKTNTTTAIR